MNKCIVNKLIKEIEEIQETDKWLNLRSIASNREVRNLEKENARLREALESLIFHCEDYGLKEESMAILMAVKTARQALKQGKEEE